MSYTKGKLEIFIGKHNNHKLCMKGSTTDILEDVISELAFANLDEIARRWNSHDELLEACKKIHTAIGKGDPIEISNICVKYVLAAISTAEQKGE